METTNAAARGLKASCKNFLQDLEALPQEVFCKSFGASCRTVADIVYEVNLVNDHVGMVIRGEQPFVWPEERWIKAPAEFCSKEIVMGAFASSSERIVSTVEGFSDEEMEASIRTEDGETTRSERCRFMTLHLWYHSGQLNFIQAMLGDETWHWK